MKVYVGYDTREDIAYQVCEHSIKRRNGKTEVQALKQSDLRTQGLYTREIDKLSSTEFTFTRFLIPYLHLLLPLEMLLNHSGKDHVVLGQEQLLSL